MVALSRGPRRDRRSPRRDGRSIGCRGANNDGTLCMPGGVLWDPCDVSMLRMKCIEGPADRERQNTACLLIR